VPRYRSHWHLNSWRSSAADAPPVFRADDGGGEDACSGTGVLAFGRRSLGALLVVDVLDRIGRMREVAGAAGRAAALALAADHVGAGSDAAAAVLRVDQVSDPSRAEGAECELFRIVDASGPAAGTGVGDQGVRVAAGPGAQHLDASAGYLMPASGIGDRDVAPGAARGSAARRAIGMTRRSPWAWIAPVTGMVTSRSRWPRTSRPVRAVRSARVSVVSMSASP